MVNKDKILVFISRTLIVLALLPLLHYARRGLVCDRFVVRGDSMEPTFHTGEKVWVNKLLMGPRIYRKWEFEDGSLYCFRLPGIRGLRVGDAAIFNMPYGNKWGHISFKLNYVYMKRCVGCPGDTVSIIDSRYYNSRTGYEVGIPSESVARLESEPDSVLLKGRSFKAGQFAGKGDVWTVREFGPLAIPTKGSAIRLDSAMVERYSVILEYELGHKVIPDGSEYRFQHDYYFFAGDNMVNSRDSRFFGFVPDDYVVGVVVNN